MGVVQIALAVFFEVGLVPSTALETESRRRDQAAQLGFAAFRAVRQGRITHALDFFKFVLAGTASVFVDGHGVTPVKTSEV